VRHFSWFSRSGPPTPSTPLSRSGSVPVTWPPCFPPLWRWSSFRAYALGEAGRIKVNDWRVLKMKVRPVAASVDAPSEATSRKPREVAHPRLIRVRCPYKPRYTSPVNVAHPPRRKVPMNTSDSDAIGGTLLFSRSAFRSWSFLASTIVGLLCIAYDLYLLIQHWRQLSPPGALTLWMAGCGVAGSWRRVLSYHNRARIAYRDRVVGPQSNSELRDMLNRAGRALNDSMFFFLTVILLLLVYIGHTLA